MNRLKKPEKILQDEINIPIYTSDGGEEIINRIISYLRNNCTIDRVLVFDDDVEIMKKRIAPLLKPPVSPVAKYINVEDFIKTIRESFIGSEMVYTRGSCYQFFRILKSVFPQAEAWFDMNHVITLIDGKFYDITGEVKKGGHLRMEEHYATCETYEYRFSIFKHVPIDQILIPDPAAKKKEHFMEVQTTCTKCGGPMDRNGLLCLKCASDF